MSASTTEHAFFFSSSVSGPASAKRQKKPLRPPNPAEWVDGKWRCQHDRDPDRCRDCQNTQTCCHDLVLHLCEECNEGGNLCIHDKHRSNCKECCGVSICEHGRQRYGCKECGGGGICEHGKERSYCKKCVGSGICEHGRNRYYCKECGGKGALAAEAKKEAKTEFVKRYVRDAHLRDKWLDLVVAEQGGRCNGFFDCTGVAGGEAVNQCPWGDRAVAKWAQQLDHIVQFAQTQDDSRENLQMLCACCHAGKTAAERGAASVGSVA